MGFPAERIETGNDTPPVECSPAAPDEATRARIDAAWLEMRLADLQRWGALLADECERFADEARARTVTADVACGLADCASDAVIDACTRVNAARRALRVFDARRELNDAALRVRKEAA